MVASSIFPTRESRSRDWEASRSDVQDIAAIEHATTGEDRTVGLVCRARRRHLCGCQGDRNFHEPALPLLLDPGCSGWYTLIETPQYDRGCFQWLDELADL